MAEVYPEWDDFKPLLDGWHLFKVNSFKFGRARDTQNPIGSLEAEVCQGEDQAGSRAWRTFTFSVDGKPNLFGIKACLFFLSKTGILPYKAYSDEFFESSDNRKKVQDKLANFKFGGLTTLEINEDTKKPLARFKDFCPASDIREKQEEWKEEGSNDKGASKSSKNSKAAADDWDTPEASGGNNNKGEEVSTETAKPEDQW